MKCDISGPGQGNHNQDMEVNGDSKSDSDDKDEDIVYQPMEIVPSNKTTGEENGGEVTSSTEKAPLKLIVRKSRLVPSDSPVKDVDAIEETSNDSKGSSVQNLIPGLPELLNDSGSDDTKDSTELKLETPPPPDLPVIEKMTKPPYKGTMVPCGKLKDYLDSLPTFNRKCMLRKGREVHKIYVDMAKGETFLDDQFSYTEFGKMVLTNGSIRAGRAKNAKQIVVARETLYCSGTAACKRACGGYGTCLAGKVYVHISSKDLLLEHSFLSRRIIFKSEEVVMHFSKSSCEKGMLKCIT